MTDLIGTIRDEDEVHRESSDDEDAEPTPAPVRKGASRKGRLSQAAPTKPAGPGPEISLEFDFGEELDPYERAVHARGTWDMSARYNEDQLRRARSLDEKIEQARARRKAKGLDAEDNNDADENGAEESESESESDDDDEEAEAEAEEEVDDEADKDGAVVNGEEEEEAEEEAPAVEEVSDASEEDDENGFFQSEGSAKREVAETLARRQRSRVLADQGMEEATGGRDESFAALHLSRPLLRAVSAMGFGSPTPIQRRVVPLALAGKDVCASAQTGSGKTAAFLLPLLERLLFRSRRVAATRVLVVAPTRELATQCRAMMGQLAQFTDVRSTLVVGGLSIKEQEAELRARPDVVICTPGRMIDHLRNSSAVDVDDLEALVLDEADRLLELGFQDELEELIGLCPARRQTLLFSATMTDSVDRLAALSLKRPVRVNVDNVKAVADNVTQEFVKLRKRYEYEREAVLMALITRSFKKEVIIFCQNKRTAHRLVLILGLAGLRAAELHGNLTQSQRLTALQRFRDGIVDFLVATDLAGRGLDIKGVRTVINFSMPKELTRYIHRNERKIMKDAVKRAKGPAHARSVPDEAVSFWKDKVESFQDDIRTIIQQEREERALRIAEMEARKAKNLIEFEDEIKARPARTWFQSEREKKEARERMKKREAGKEGEEAGEGEAGAENAKDRKARLWREKQEAKRGEKEKAKKQTHRLSRAKRRRMEAREDEAEMRREMAKEKEAERERERREGQQRAAGVVADGEAAYGLEDEGPAPAKRRRGAQGAAVTQASVKAAAKRSKKAQREKGTAVTKVAAERLSRGQHRYAADAPTGFDVDLSDPRARAAAGAAGDKRGKKGTGKGKGSEPLAGAGHEPPRGGADALAWAKRPKSKKAHHAFKSKRRFKRR